MTTPRARKRVLAIAALATPLLVVLAFVAGMNAAARSELATMGSANSSETERGGVATTEDTASPVESDPSADEEFERGWQINVRGLLQSVRQGVGPMREQGAGAIVVTGATASLRGKPFTAAFAQAKAAQRSLAQSFARQLGPEGIHVAVVIVDGMIGTDDQDEDATALRPADIAETVHHLATQPKSAWSFEVDVRPFNENW